MKRFLLLAIAVCAFFLPVSTRAGEVAPAGKGKDIKRINEELKKTGYVRLQEGKVYYLTSYIRLNTNNRIDASGATIIVSKHATRNDPSNYRKDYSSMKNIRITGGTWLSNKAKGNSGTTFSFAHCQDIVLENMMIKTTNAEGHAIELVGCKNVRIEGCRIEAQGKGKSKSVEEMVQIDLAAPKTAPFLSRKFQNGLTCRNITVKDCVIRGNRALTCNFAKVDKKFRNRYHSNITVTGCTLTGTKSEAFALFNTDTAIIKNNTMISNSSRTKESYSVGCHVSVFGKAPAFSKGSILIEGNTIKGGRQGFFLSSHTSERYGKVILKDNSFYAKNGVAYAAMIAKNTSNKSSAILSDFSNNNYYKWK